MRKRLQAMLDKQEVMRRSVQSDRLSLVVLVFSCLILPPNQSTDAIAACLAALSILAFTRNVSLAVLARAVPGIGSSARALRRLGVSKVGSRLVVPLRATNMSKEPANNACARSLRHHAPRLSAVEASWPAAQLGGSAS